MNVLTCENALLSLRQKLACWGNRSAPRSPACHDSLQVNNNVIVIVPAPQPSTGSPQSTSAIMKTVASVPIKDVVLFGTLYSSPSVWALLTRGTRRRLGINLFQQLPLEIDGVAASIDVNAELDQRKCEEAKENMHPIGSFPKEIAHNTEVLHNRKQETSYTAEGSESSNGGSQNSLINGSERGDVPRLAPFNSLNSINADEICNRDLSDPAIALWSRSLSDLLDDPFGCHAFEKFLNTEYSCENLKFWMECNQYAHTKNPKERRQLAHTIWERYMGPSAMCTINIDSDSRKSFLATLRSRDDPPIDLFKLIKEHIYNLMKYDSYQRFLRSSHFTSCQNPIASLPDCSLNQSEKNLIVSQVVSSKLISNSATENINKDSRPFPVFQWARAMTRWKRTAKDKKQDLNENANDPARNFICTLILPSNITVRVNIKDSEQCLQNKSLLKTKKILGPILKKRGLVWYRTFMEDSITGQRIDYESIVTRIFGRRMFVRPYCLIAFSMPDRRIVIFRSVPTDTIRQCLEIILNSCDYSMNIDKCHFGTLDTDIQIITSDDIVKSYDNRCIAVRSSALKLTESKIDFDYFREIPDDDDLIVFEKCGVLSTKIIRPPEESLSNLGHKLIQTENKVVPQTLLAVSTCSSDDSPPAEFRRLHQLGGLSPAMAAESPSFNDMTPPLNDCRPVQFMFSVDSISPNQTTSSLSSLDSLQDTNRDPYWPNPKHSNQSRGAVVIRAPMRTDKVRRSLSPSPKGGADRFEDIV